MEKLKKLIDSEQIQNRVKALGLEITEHYKGRPLTVVCILNGAFVFCADLIRQIENDEINIEVMCLSSYGSSSVSSGKIQIIKDTETDLNGKDVLVVEDIVDTGRTLSFVMAHLKAKGASSVALCALIDKPSRRVVPVKTDWVGIEVPDTFIVGYGLDYDQRYRHLPYIAEVEL